MYTDRATLGQVWGLEADGSPHPWSLVPVQHRNPQFGVTVKKETIQGKASERSHPCCSFSSSWENCLRWEGEVLSAEAAGLCCQKSHLWSLLVLPHANVAPTLSLIGPKDTVIGQNGASLRMRIWQHCSDWMGKASFPLVEILFQELLSRTVSDDITV